MKHRVWAMPTMIVAVIAAFLIANVITDSARRSEESASLGAAGAAATTGPGGGSETTESVDPLADRIDGISRQRRAGTERGDAEEKDSDAASNDDAEESESEPEDAPESDRSEPKPPSEPRSAAGGGADEEADQRVDGTPDFQLPFTCESRVRLTTYFGHNPDDKKVDFFNDQGQTSGMQVVSSADGRVMKLPSPGGVKIDHGNGWYTLFIHMQNIEVSVGQQVDEGDPIGRIGSVGTGVAHLHYEQLHNPNGGEAFTEPHIQLPVFDGEEHTMVPRRDNSYPVETSANSC